MDNHFKQITNFIRDIGAADVSHSEKTYLAHTIGVYNDLKSWDCDEELCDAGMFHSIYGTVVFEDFVLPLHRRGDVRDLIGERAERLAYLNSAMIHEVFDETVLNAQEPHRFVDRFTDEELQLSPDDFRDLCTIQICDWLEQVERLKWWDFRRDSFRRMAEWLGGVALEPYDRVFANESAA